jgi:plastocyanin
VKVLLSLIASLFVSTGVLAAEAEFVIVIKNHKFEPSEVAVPANQKVKLIVDNQDTTAEEFESKSLKREKVIAGKTKATITVGPLAPGRYPFVGEYNEKTAQGVIVVK